MNDLNIENGLKNTMNGASKTEGRVVEFSVENATCGHCKARIERWTQAQPGVQSAVFDLETKKLTVVCAEGQGPTNADVIAGLAAEGYPTTAAA